jgi:excisionase family DNA binding protein
MTPNEAADYLGLPQNTLAQYRSQKKGPPYFKIEGHLVRYSVEDLEEWLEQQRVKVTDSRKQTG